MHASSLRSCVLWYDSVVLSGALKWQNQLNDLNKFVPREAWWQLIVHHVSCDVFYAGSFSTHVMAYSSTTTGTRCF